MTKKKLISLVFFFFKSDVETGGLISKVLLANADALCAAVSPLMDVEEDNSLVDSVLTMFLMKNQSWK